MHTAPIEYKTNGSYYRVIISAHLPDDTRDYFSCNYSQDVKVNGRWRDDSCGIAPAELVARFAPQFADVHRLHLADRQGAPMHAQSNALYWAAGASERGLFRKYHGGSGPIGDSKHECLTTLAEHLRVPMHVAVDLVAQLDAIEHAHPVLATLPAEHLKAWIERECVPAWRAEAAACFLKHGGA